MYEIITISLEVHFGPVGEVLRYQSSIFSNMSQLLHLRLPDEVYKLGPYFLQPEDSQVGLGQVLAIC